MIVVELVGTKWIIVKTVETGRLNGVSLKEFTHELLKGNAAAQLLEQLRASGYPIMENFGPDGSRWVLDTRYQAGRIVQFLPTELIKYAYFRNKFEHLKGSLFLEYVQQAIGFLVPDLGQDAVEFVSHYDEIEKGKELPTLDANLPQFAILETLLKAASSRRRLRINYIAASAGITSVKNIEPQCLFLHDGKISLIAQDTVRGEFRIFDISHIKKIDILEDSFQPKEIDAVEICNIASSGVDWKKTLAEVKIRCTKHLRPTVASRAWNSTQELTDNPDGTFDFNVKISINAEFVDWVISLGSNATVLSPTHLVQDVRNRLQNLIQVYFKSAAQPGAPAVTATVAAPEVIIEGPMLAKNQVSEAAQQQHVSVEPPQHILPLTQIHKPLAPQMPVAPSPSARSAGPAVIMVPPVSASPGRDDRRYDLPAELPYDLPAVPKVEEAKQIKEKKGDIWSVMTISGSGENGNVYSRLDGFTTQKVRDKLKAKEIKYTDLIWKKGSDNWLSIGMVDDFDRRRPRIYEEQPKPEVSQVISLNQLEGSNGLGRMIPPDDLQRVSGYSSELPKPHVAAPVPEASDDYSVTDFKQAPKRRMMFGGAVAMMLSLFVVAVGAYLKDAGHEVHNPLKDPPRKIAESKGGREAAMTRPLHPEEIPAGNPSSPAQGQTAVPRDQLSEPGVLKITGDQLTSENPLLLVETNMGSGTPVEIEISARPGAVLDYPSYFLKKEIRVSGDKITPVDLGADHLPAGHYQVMAHVGETTALAFIELGTSDPNFKIKLEDYRKKIATQAHSERVLLRDGVQFGFGSLVKLAKDFSKAKLDPTGESRRTWTKDMKKWLREFDQENKKVQAIGEMKRNNYSYPNQLLKLKSLEQQLLNYAKSANAALRSGEGEESVREFKDSLVDQFHQLQGEVLALAPKTTKPVVFKANRTPVPKQKAAHLTRTLPPKEIPLDAAPLKTGSLDRPATGSLVASRQPQSILSLKKFKRVRIDFGEAEKPGEDSVPKIIPKGPEAAAARAHSNTGKEVTAEEMSEFQ